MTIWEMSLGGAVLIAAILLLRRLALYRLPKWTFLLLWAVALARLLLPVSLPSPVSVYSGAERLWQAVQLAEETPPVPFTPDLQDRVPERPVNDAPAAPAPAAPALAEPASPAVPLAPAAPEMEKQPAFSPVMAVYLTGVCLLAVFFGAAYWRCCRMFRQASIAENAVLTRWRAEHPGARVRFRQSGEITAPLTYGLLYPTVLFPLGTDWTDGEALRYVLAHEYIHICRRDVWWKLLLTAAVCLHWFNPLVWAMYVYANRDIELSCDEAVVHTFGLPVRPDYAMSLLNAQSQRRLLPLCSGYSSRNAMEERIVAIMRSRKLTAAAVLAALVLVCGMAAVFAGTPVEPMAEVAELVRGEAVRTLDSPYQKDHIVVPSSGISGFIIRRYEKNTNYGLVEAGVLPDGTEYWVVYLTPAETIQHMTNRRCWHVKACVPIGDTAEIGRALVNPLSVDEDTYIVVDVDGLATAMAPVEVGCFSADGKGCTVKLWDYHMAVFKPAHPEGEITVKVSTHGEKRCTAQFRVYTTQTNPAPVPPVSPEPETITAEVIPAAPAPAEPASRYPVNSLGHTYGRWTEADGYDDVPDLIWYQVDRETVGYLKREEVYPYSYPIRTQEEIQRYLDWYNSEIAVIFSPNSSFDYQTCFALYTQEEELTNQKNASFVWDGCRTRTVEALLARIEEGTPLRLVPCEGSAPVENKPHQPNYLGIHWNQYCASAEPDQRYQALLDEYVGEDGDWHRNSRGETYGDYELAFYVGYYPDLIGCKNNCLGEPDIKYYYTPFEELQERRKQPKQPGSYPVYDVEHNLIGYEVITDGPPSRINNIHPLEEDD